MSKIINSLLVANKVGFRKWKVVVIMKSDEYKLSSETLGMFKSQKQAESFVLDISKVLYR